ncbi:nitrilase [Coccidioides immitis RS]|uniref:Nitrilase n=3 Tax=Coccidioides immitis TaxID=5501 RepID=J3K9L9_COCIM|nr:nitrilase [Coccidioides immitis RS]EAS31615.3 nitrilase [Coccidioides immitis RS]KMP04267.1 hydrolase [Coccidioides immitis RMSCC 2394]KMU73397.1 hydrolase [Coccidioides immitis RMSCC 3703]
MTRAAVGQLCSTASMAHNLIQCQILVHKAVSAGAKALFLPEASDYIAASPAESLFLVRPVNESDFVLGLQKEARLARLPINVGIHEPAQGGEKVKNTLIWIDETGKITQRYQKIHLFDVDIKGGPVLKESRSVEKGMKIVPPFETPVGRLGLSICFDLRFPEISLALRRQGAQIITYPSAFTIPTGQAHWETLLRARAIETQSYIVAAAQCGQHNNKRFSYGHSMIVNPWGEIVAKLGSQTGEPEIAVADIDFKLLEKVRNEMPLLRRTDIYPEV